MISIATNNLKKVRLDKGLTLAEVASKLGIAPSTLSQYELTKREPKVKTWEKLAEFYNCSVSYLTGLSNDQDSAFTEKEVFNFALQAISPPSSFEKAANLGCEMKKSAISTFSSFFLLLPIKGFTMKLIWLTGYII